MFCKTPGNLLFGSREQAGSSTKQADLGDIAGLVLDHRNEANITINQVTQIFCFPSAYKSKFTLYCSLLSVQ